LLYVLFFFFKQKTAYEIGTGDWSSDVCSSDLFYFQLPACRCRSEMRLRILRENGTGYALQMDMHAVGEVLEALGQVGQPCAG